MTDELTMIERAAYDRGFFDGFNAGIHSMREDIEKANAERAKAILERDALLSDFLKGFQDQVQKEHGIYRCDICKYGFENNPQGTTCHKEHCDGYTNWEWRGANSNEDKQYGD